MLRLLVLATLLPGHPLGPQGRRGADPANLPAVARVVLRNFDAWDRDHDRSLSRSDVDHAALSPWWHGEDAAALAALHLYLFAAKEGASPLTRESFLSYQPTRLTLPPDVDSSESKRLRDAYAANPGSLQSSYAACLRRLVKPGATNLFVGNGPCLADVKQGPLGDCYLLAALGAYVNRDPSAVASMFRSDGAGGFAVAFGDGKTVQVGRTSDAEIAMGGSSTGHGLWARVVEKAYGSRDFAPDAMEDRVASDTLHGGNPAKAGRGFTGHRFRFVRLIDGYRKETSDTELAPKLDALRRELSQAFAQRQLVLACTSKGEMPASINGHHAYAVFGFDAATDMITIWNPHASDFEPKGTEGVENGFRRKGGVFAMPLPLFERAFQYAMIEQNSAPRPTR